MYMAPALINQWISHFRQHINTLRYKVTQYSSRAVRDKDGGFTGGNFARLEAYSKGHLIYAKDAFSNYSNLRVALKPDFVPPVGQAELDSVGIARNHQTANHTEPKLFLNLIHNIRQYGLNPDHITLVSERDCCPMCLEHSINALNGIAALIQLSGQRMDVVVVETMRGRVCEAHELIPRAKL